MKNKLLCLIIITKISANDVSQDNTYIWNQVEQPSVENNFNTNHKIYQTNNISDAIGTTIIESLLHFDKVTEKKMLNTDFKYLKEFENSVKK